MIELKLGIEARCRVWIGELPDVSYAPARNVVCNVEGIGHKTPKCTLAAVELFAHRGGYCPYRLLGARFVPNNAPDRRIIVALSDTGRRLLDGSLAGLNDRVTVGLADEFAKSVIQDASAAVTATNLSSGTLYFDHAAHGEIGSSPVVFRLLADKVVRILATESNVTPVEEVRAMLEESSTGRYMKRSLSDAYALHVTITPNEVVDVIITTFLDAIYCEET